MKKRILTLIFSLILIMGVMACAKNIRNAAEAATLSETATDTFVVETSSVNAPDLWENGTDF